MLMLALSACALPIEPAESGLVAPARFVSAGATPAAAAPPDPDWWRAFGAPDLDRLMAGAMAGNLDMAASIAGIPQCDPRPDGAGQQELASAFAFASWLAQDARWPLGDTPLEQQLQQAMNAVQQIPAPDGQESGTVITVYQKGYKLGDKIVRHATVVVAE